MPAVRKIRFDPSHRPGEATPIEVEDFALGYAEAGKAASIEPLLQRLWLLRMSRRPAEDSDDA